MSYDPRLLFDIHLFARKPFENASGYLEKLAVRPTNNRKTSQYVDRWNIQATPRRNSPNKGQKSLRISASAGNQGTMSCCRVQVCHFFARAINSLLKNVDPLQL